MFKYVWRGIFSAHENQYVSNLPDFIPSSYWAGDVIEIFKDTSAAPTAP